MMDKNKMFHEQDYDDVYEYYMSHFDADEIISRMFFAVQESQKLVVAINKLRLGNEDDFNKIKKLIE